MVPISLQASQDAYSTPGLGVNLNGDVVLPLGLLGSSALPGSSSHLQKILDHARALDPLADSVNFLWDSSASAFKFSYRIQTSVWTQPARALAKIPGTNSGTEPLLLSAGSLTGWDGSALSLGPARALANGGWAVPVLVEDFISVNGNFEGSIAGDLFDDARELLLQGAGQIRFGNESYDLALDYAAEEMVVPERDYQRVLKAWEKVLWDNGVNATSSALAEIPNYKETTLCQQLKTTINLQIPTQRLCGLVHRTNSSAAESLSPDYCQGADQSAPVVLQITPPDFCQCPAGMCGMFTLFSKLVVHA